MPNKRIFLTGASGCIGHYIADALIQETGHDLYLLVRDPKKLQFDYESRPGVTIIKGDLREIKHFADLLATIDVAILAATSWGGQQESFDINVVKTTQLVKLLDPAVCQQVIYFSTASILDNNNQLLRQAGHFGTDYIRSKYDCYRQLEKLTTAPPITAVYPTLVFGGDDNKPYSHISAGLPDVLKWIDLVRFFKADGSFHFIHGRDIATVIRYLVDNPPPLPERRRSGITNQWVLGNQRVTANQAVEEICDYLGKKIHFRIPLSLGLAEVIINILRTFGVKIEISAWDWFCMRYRHFTYQDAVNPSTFGLSTYCPTLRDLLKLRGIPQGTPASGVKSTQRARLVDDEPLVIPPENQLPADTQASGIRNFSTLLDEPAPPSVSTEPETSETLPSSEMQAFPEFLRKPDDSIPDSEPPGVSAETLPSSETQAFPESLRKPDDSIAASETPPAVNEFAHPGEEVSTLSVDGEVSTTPGEAGDISESLEQPAPPLTSGETLEASTHAVESAELSSLTPPVEETSTFPVTEETERVSHEGETASESLPDSVASTIAIEPAEVSPFPQPLIEVSTLPAATGKTETQTNIEEEKAIPIEEESSETSLETNSTDIPIEDKQGE